MLYPFDLFRREGNERKAALKLTPHLFYQIPDLRMLGASDRVQPNHDGTGIGVELLLL